MFFNAEGVAIRTLSHRALIQQTHRNLRQLAKDGQRDKGVLEEKMDATLDQTIRAKTALDSVWITKTEKTDTLLESGIHLVLVEARLTPLFEISPSLWKKKEKGG